MKIYKITRYLHINDQNNIIGYTNDPEEGFDNLIRKYCKGEGLLDEEIEQAVNARGIYGRTSAGTYNIDFYKNTIELDKLIW